MTYTYNITEADMLNAMQLNQKNCGDKMAVSFAVYRATFMDVFYS